uniref:Dolichyl-diphosphooligosaccharide--protein glycosyltransferase subunit 2 n=1 Tax=Brassica campestris TaxID=3711 RepID=M4FCG5_BRACM
MARGLSRFLVPLLLVAICNAASVSHPISDSHRSAALDVFVPLDGSYKSLEEAYEALKSLEILGIDKKSDLSSVTCENVVKVLGSPSSALKDVFYALSVNGILKCKSGEDVSKDIVSKLQAGAKDAKLLLDFYYSIRGLVLVKEQFAGTDPSLGDAAAIFRSIKALSQSDGRWRYSSNNAESSTFAAGLAFETLAGVISLAPSEIDQSLIQTVKTGILKLFDSIQKYDDGTFYFDGSEGPISTTASVIRGLTSFAASESTGLNLPGDKIVGLAKFFLGVGIPGDAKDFFNQIDALACLEDNRQGYFHAIYAIYLLRLVVHHLRIMNKMTAEMISVEKTIICATVVVYDFRFSVPLILSLPSTVISLSKKEPLKVKVSTVLGSKAPALSVKLAQALNSKGSSVINNQELKFDADSATYFLDSFPKNFDVGKYTFVFEILLDESANEKAYITEAQTKVPIAATGAISIENAEIAVLDSDVGSVESQKKLDLTKDGGVSLSANHLQKLRLSFQLTTPLGLVFKPHQAFLKLKHESQVEHIFLVKTSGKKSEVVLVKFLKLRLDWLLLKNYLIYLLATDFLGLVEKLYYLSGKYEIQLTIGDASMENSLLSNIGHIELDLPERPEKAPLPPLQPTDPYSRFVPKAEISHIFRVPEKLPAKQLSLIFLGLIVLPFIFFLIGLTRLGVNIKSFPSSVGAATSALLFHGGIGAVLLLYVLFWLKASSQKLLDLFTTLKALSLLGVFLLFVGHRTLSNLAAASNKLKSA